MFSGDIALEVTVLETYKFRCSSKYLIFLAVVTTGKQSSCDDAYDLNFSER